MLLTTAALIAFAANSLLCRLALAPRELDAASFTAIRLASGALVLAALAARRPRGPGGTWGSATALFAYAAPFSYAYLELGAGIGALVLFGAVQTTMIGWAIARGERPRPAVWIGVALALGGLVALAAPGRTAPDPLATALMALAGVAWGVYSLRGRAPGADPLRANAGNFLRATPMALALVGIALVAAPAAASPSARGVALAVASGAIASGIGYSVWYAALRGLAATQAAVVQLLVPVIAAAGGVALLGEAVTWRLAGAAAAILGGVALAIRARR